MLRALLSTSLLVIVTLFAFESAIIGYAPISLAETRVRSPEGIPTTDPILLLSFAFTVNVMPEMLPHSIMPEALPASPP